MDSNAAVEEIIGGRVWALLWSNSFLIYIVNGKLLYQHISHISLLVFPWISFSHRKTEFLIWRKLRHMKRYRRPLFNPWLDEDGFVINFSDWDIFILCRLSESQVEKWPPSMTLRRRNWLCARNDDCVRELACLSNYDRSSMVEAELDGFRIRSCHKPQWWYCKCLIYGLLQNHRLRLIYISALV